jgi:hypothetical protein
MEYRYLYLSVSPTQKDEKNRPLIKIGKTNKTINIRMNSLSKHSGVSSDFKCIYLYECEDATWLESQIHLIFQDLRWKPNKEFFSVTPKSAIMAIERYKGKALDLAQFASPIIKAPKKKQMEISEYKKSRILTLYRKGIPQTEISKDLNVTPHHVSKTVKEYKIKNGSISL